MDCYCDYYCTQTDDDEMEQPQEITTLMEGGPPLVLGYTGDSVAESRVRRYTQLCEALRMYGVGLYPRRDSVLCCHYILFGTRKLEEVVSAMVRMDFLYKHTRYAKVLRRSGIRKEDFDTLDEYAKATEPIQAVAAANWCRHFGLPVYMIPDPSLRDDVYHSWFGDYRHLLWRPHPLVR